MRFGPLFLLLPLLAIAQPELRFRSTESLKNEATRAFQSENYGESLRLWKILIDRQPSRALFHYNLAQTFYVQGKRDQAKESFKKAATLGGALSSVSMLYLAQIYRLEGETQKALFLLKKLLDRKLPTALENFMLDEINYFADEEADFLDKGDSYFDKGEYEKAFLAYEYAWVINPASGTYFMMGYCQLKRGNYPRAKFYFNQIKDEKIHEDAMDLWRSYQYPPSAEEPPPVEKEEEPKEETTEEPEVTKPELFSGYIDLSLGKNSNPNTEADSASISSDTEYMGSFGLAYLYGYSTHWKLKISVDAYVDIFASDDTTKSTGWGPSLPIYFNTTNMTVSLTPKYEPTNYGGDPYVTNSSLALSHAHFLPFGKTKATATYTQYDSRSSTYSYLDGDEVSADFYYTHYLGEDDVTLGATYQKDDLTDSSSSIGSKVAWGGELEYYHPLSEKISLDTTVNYLNSTYEPDSDGFVQQDNTLTVYLTLNLVLDEYSSFYIKDRWIKNSSNLSSSDDDNNYKQNLISAGVSASF